MIEIMSRKIETPSIKSFMEAIKIIYGWKEKVQGSRVKGQGSRVKGQKSKWPKVFISEP
jgi:hypothetical protein